MKDPIMVPAGHSVGRNEVQAPKLQKPVEWKGRVKPDVSFSIEGEVIPTVNQQPVKSLGRIYNASHA